MLVMAFLFVLEIDFMPLLFSASLEFVFGEEGCVPGCDAHVENVMGEKGRKEITQSQNSNALPCAQMRK